MHVQTILALVVISVLVAASALKESQCERSCGGVDIPFPFGLEEGCFHSPQFNVTCNRSLAEHTPFYGDVVVTDISLDTGEIEIMMTVAHACYSSSGGNTRNNDAFLQLGDFRISTKNRFVAIGCDTLAYIEGQGRLNHFGGLRRR